MDSKEVSDFSGRQDLMDKIVEDEEVDFLDYARIVWRYKWGIFGLTLLSAVWGLFLAYSETPIYESTTTLLVEPKKDNVINIQDVYSADASAGSYLDSQVKILRSRLLAEKVVSKLKLDAHLTATAASADQEVDKLAGIFAIDWSGWIQDEMQSLGFSQPRSDGPQQGEVQRTELLKNFLGSLTVLVPGGSTAIEIKYRSSDRLMAAKTANTLADVYIENELEARVDMTTKANSWLMGRLEGLRNTLRDSEVALQAFRESEDIVAVSGSTTLTEQRMQSLNQQLSDAQKVRNEIKLALNQVSSFDGGDLKRLASVPVVMNDPVFSSLHQKETEAERQLEVMSKRYGPKHPKMLRAKLDVETAVKNTQQRLSLILDGLQDEYKIANANVSGLQAQFNASSGDLRNINRKGHELSFLEREVATNQELYDRFLSRFKETSETGGLEKVNARVIDPAIPALTPIKPNKKKIVSISALLGLSIGILIAVMLERMDKTLKRPSDIEEKLHIPAIAGIPFIKLKARKGESPLSYANENRTSFFAESLRTLRTGILLSSMDSPHKIIVVTSSVPGEGKSTVAINLANSIGGMEKVLLVDADMRRPTVGKVWGLEKDAKGLSEFVSESAKLGECVHSITGVKVYIMPSGAIPPNPLELLSSRRFAKALIALSSEFNHIIIDSPPAMVVSDALVLSSYATGVVYVVKAVSTPFPLAREGIKRLVNANAHIVGGVLNGLPVNAKGKYYGNYRYLGYSHSEHYGEYGYGNNAA